MTRDPPTGRPWAQSQVTFRTCHDGVRLAGTLVVPRGGGRRPVVVLVTGSGPQDRDGMMEGLPHRPFERIAQRLARAGIATLRFDDRGIGASEGAWEQTTIADQIADISGAMALVRAQPRIDAARVAVLGHSEGALVAAGAAARADAAALVLLGGPGLSAIDTLLLQTQRIEEAYGTPPTVLDRILFHQRAIYTAIRDEEPVAALEAILRTAAADPVLGGEGKTPEQIEEEVAASLPYYTGVELRSSLQTDPVALYSAVAAPTLALFGGLDLQVPPAEHESAMAAAFGLGSASLKTKTLVGHNHLFQRAVTGLPDEYANAARPAMTNRLLRKLERWLTRRLIV